MKLIYIDEAGNTGDKADPDQPIHMLGALIVPEDQVRPAETAIRSVAKKYFGDAAVDPGVELHGHHIRGGKGAFRQMDVERRLELTKELLAIPGQHCIQFGYAAIDKAKLRRLTSKHPHELAFMFLVERVQDILEREAQLGLLIADEQEEMEDRLIANLDVYKNHRTNWGYRPTAINNIVDSIHFVKSRNNWLIQLADVVTFVAARGLRTDNQLWTRWTALSPRPSDYMKWVDENATRSQKADRELLRHLPNQRFSKLYP